MNARLPLLAAALLSLALAAPAKAADLTWTYSPTEANTGAQTINEITITPTYVWKTSESFSNNSGLQIGKTGYNAISVTYDFTAFPADITSIAVTGKTASGNSENTTVSATIGTDACSGTASLIKTESTITLTPAAGTQTGNLSIRIDNPKGDSANLSSQAIYLRSIVVTYKDPAAADLTQLDAPTDLADSNVGFNGFDLSWTGVSDANGYAVTLSPADGTVTVDGTTATATGLAEGTLYHVYVVAKGDGTTTDDSIAATIDVTTATAPAVVAPALTSSDVSSSSLTVSWPAQDAAASYGVRAWTLIPADVATEDFAGYPDIEPEGWTFNGTEENTTTGSAKTHPVAFKSSCSIVSPVYPGDINALSFNLQHGNATSSSFAVYGSNDGGATWVLLVEYANAGTHISNGEKTISVSVPGIRQIKFEFTKSSGNLYFGSFSVSGAGVGKQPSYLTGYGPDATGVGTASSVTLTPVAGEKNYIEVTATGLSGKTASATLEVDVPSAAESASVVISVR